MDNRHPGTAPASGRVVRKIEIPRIADTNDPRRIPSLA
jgi:hypothetical protein